MITDIIIDDKKTIWKYAKVSVENTKVYNCIVDKKNEFWNGWVNAYLTKDSFQEYYNGNNDDNNNDNDENNNNHREEQINRIYNNKIE